MALTTIDDVANALGRPTPTAPETQQQWNHWIQGVELLIRQRARSAGVDFATLDPDSLKYVATEAVAAIVRAPGDGATSVEVAVDDGRAVRRYNQSSTRVSLWPDLWALLGLPDDDTSGAFTINLAHTPDRRDPTHRDHWGRR